MSSSNDSSSTAEAASGVLDRIYDNDYRMSTDSQQMQLQQKPATLPCLWYWEGDDGSWYLYDGSSGFVSSDDVEESYRKDHNGCYAFSTNGYSYKIDFASKKQLNETTKKRRRIRCRSVIYNWYWQDGNGEWIKYDSKVGGASLNWITEAFCNSHDYRYEYNGGWFTIDFKNMIEKNEQTGTTRPVKQEVLYAPLVLAPDNRAESQPQQPIVHDWYWLDNDGSWQLYDGALPSSFIEAKYRADSHAIFTFDQWYTIDFNTMEQTNLKSGITRQVVRKPREVPFAAAASYFPMTWDFNAPLTAGGYQLIDIAPVGSTADEYQAVERLFNESMSSVPLKSVKRIQNNRLWEPFAVAQRQLEGRMGRGNGVKQLFHGGRHSTYGAICAQGFDWRLCGKVHGTIYGRGSYFAQQASNSRRYADSNALFVAQVIVGESAVGSRDIIRPPPKDPSEPNGILYDSCVDDLVNPSIFVVFERAHCYPQYLIEY